MEAKQFKVGQRWRMRNGEVATVGTIFEAAIVASWANNRSTFSANGTYWPDGRKSAYDLLTLLEDAPAPAAQQVAAPSLPEPWITARGGEPLPPARSTLARALLYTETVNDEQVCRDDLWIVTSEVVNKTARADAAQSALLTAAQQVIAQIVGDKLRDCDMSRAALSNLRKAAADVEALP